MPDIRKIQKHLTAFDFPKLFVEELGWDYAREQNIPITIGNETYVLSPLVKKADVRVYQCPPDTQGRLFPDRIIRKIEKELTKYAYEHILVAIDEAKENQVWLWVKRTREKTTTPRYLRWYKGHSGEIVARALTELGVGLDEELHADTLGILEKARSAFDQEKVTKRFYDHFKLEHDAFLALIDGISSQEDREWYTSVMFNRLMFTFFIQEKGVLGHKQTGQLDGERRYLQKHLANWQGQDGQDNLFYSTFLLPLFHQGFCQRNHSPELIKLAGHVPYLNGGLFDIHLLEQRYRNITIPDKAFQRLFTFFDSYRWTLDDRPLRNDREINPDVLGYIFEKYINQKQMGAFYTKEDITGYISKNTILPSLLEATKERCEIAFKSDGPVWSLLQENPDRYIYQALKHGYEKSLPPEIAAGIQDISQRTLWNKPAPTGDNGYALSTETWRQVVARRQRYEDTKAKLEAGKIVSINDLITYNLDILQFTQDAVAYSEGQDELEAFYQVIERITILDPTCGSGAFLFAALNILETLYQLCLERMQAMVDERDHLTATLPSLSARNYPRIELFRGILREMARHPNPEYFIYKSIIVNNLYGVDIMEEAIEICKLRLFLKLVSQVKKLADLEPLPDIDFNIRAGNTLVGLATYEETVQALSEKPIIGKRQHQGEVAFQSQMRFDDTLERIKQKAEDVEQEFARFRKRQTDYDTIIEDNDLTITKKQLQSQLFDLSDELDRYLAVEYKVDRNLVPTEEYLEQVANWKQEGYGSAVEKWQKEPHLFEAYFAQWKKSHQPFHWYVEFYGIMKNGGFDVVIGNPPYVEYRKVRDEYKIRFFFTEDCGNLYAFAIEKSFALMKENGRFGMIVQLSSICTDRMANLQKLVRQSSSSVWISNFDDRPAKLFDGLEHIRASIILSEVSKRKEDQPALFATNLSRWYTEDRPLLFPFTNYHSVIGLDIQGSIPKIGSEHLKRLIEKMRQEKHSVEDVYDKNSVHRVHYYRSPLYWIRGMDFLPFFKSATASRSVHHFKDFNLSNPDFLASVGCIINSSLFYVWFIVYGNGRNIALRDIQTFPCNVESLYYEHGDELKRLFSELMQDYNEHSQRKTRKDGVQVQEFYPSFSKPIINEIDRVLAKHYGFTEEELDLVINYDIVYRMGRDHNQESEE